MKDLERSFKFVLSKSNNSSGPREGSHQKIVIVDILFEIFCLQTQTHRHTLVEKVKVHIRHYDLTKITLNKR